MKNEHKWHWWKNILEHLHGKRKGEKHLNHKLRVVGVSVANMMPGMNLSARVAAGCRGRYMYRIKPIANQWFSGRERGPQKRCPKVCNVSALCKTRGLIFFKNKSKYHIPLPSVHCARVRPKYWNSSAAKTVAGALRDPLKTSVGWTCHSVVVWIFDHLFLRSPSLSNQILEFCAYETHELP